MEQTDDEDHVWWTGVVMEWSNSEWRKYKAKTATCGAICSRHRRVELKEMQLYAVVVAAAAAAAAADDDDDDELQFYR